MVKKLLKYDLRAVFKYLLVIYAIVLGTAGLNRILQLFESKQVWYVISFRSSLILLIIGIASMLLLTEILLVQRFYKNLFTNEGYLTFTLPATIHEQLWSKIFCSVICIIATVFVMFLAFLIATSGEVFTEVMKAVNYIFRQFLKGAGALNMTFYLIEGIVLFLLGAANAVMLFDTCLTIGQLAKKHRVGLAVAIFFIQYFVMQILGTVFIIIEATKDFELFELIADAFEKNPETALHMTAIIAIAVSALLFLLYYFIMHRILKKRLNLE
ncbi:MAG: hypothetical protein IKI54_06270 [Lachnospiraceae bacterium]|nr:hypothetical protein [Lachnospiraceae bacterium]